MRKSNVAMSDGLVARRYRLGRQLGSGGMGTVWEAYDEVLRRPVALKRIRLPRSVTDMERAQLAQRALAEATAAAQLQHHGIVSIYDVVYDEESPLIVMQLVDGRSLEQMVKELGPCRPADAARIGLELLDALTTAHQAGILHRDVKPSNVMISGDGSVLLTDFSIAKVMNAPAVTSSGVLMGSPGYIAPERVLGAAVGPPADLFGMGACLYFAVEGVGPFDREDAIAGMLASAVAAHTPARNAGPLTEVIDGLLVKDPAARWSVADTRRVLLGVVRGATDEATVPTAAPWSGVATEVISGATESMTPPQPADHRAAPTYPIPGGAPVPSGGFPGGGPAVHRPAGGPGRPGGPPPRAGYPPRPAGPTPSGANQRGRVVALSIAIVLALVAGIGVAIVLLNRKPTTPITSPPVTTSPPVQPSSSHPVVPVGPLDGHGKTIRVWLTSDAKGWPEAVSAATAAFTRKTGAKVAVSYFDWSNHLTKLDSALGTSSAPDVVELGNTETPKYVFTGALADLTTQVPTFDNSATWLAGLAQPCQSAGKTYCVPYYAGARVLIYRTDLFASAGITPPKTFDELLAAAQTLRDAGVASPFYLPGRYWYAAMAFVYGKGGAIATQGADGHWRGALSSPESEAGLTDFASIARDYSAGSAALNESNQDVVFAGGSVGMMYGLAWEVARVQSLAGGALRGKVAAVPLPGYTADRTMPSGLGGSTLAVTAKSANQALAAEWIRDFTSTAVEKQLAAKGALPNSTVLLGAVASTDSGLTASSDAAMFSWATPMSPHWLDVQSARVIPNMLQQIVSGADVDTAARAADAQIEKLLNGT